MPGGINGPPVLNGAQFVYPRKTLAKLRENLVKRVGFSAMLPNLPPGLETLMDSFLESSHSHIYLRYPMLRSRRWWSIDVIQGSRFYDVPYTGAYSGENETIAFVDSNPDTITRSDGGDFTTDGFIAGVKFRITGSALNDQVVQVDSSTASTITLVSTDSLAVEAAGEPVILMSLDFEYMDMRSLGSAWIKEDDTWCSLIQGIKPELFNMTNQLKPEFFDLREFIELWPEPDKPYTLYIYGEKGIGSFEFDTDYTSVDPDAVFALALAKAKYHYGQPDYRDYYAEFNALIGKHNSGTFGDRRFIPRSRELPEGVAKYPNVTFPRP